MFQFFKKLPPFTAINYLEMCWLAVGYCSFLGVLGMLPAAIMVYLVLGLLQDFRESGHGRGFGYAILVKLAHAPLHQITFRTLIEFKNIHLPGGVDAEIGGWYLSAFIVSADLYALYGAGQKSKDKKAEAEAEANETRLASDRAHEMAVRNLNAETERKRLDAETEKARLALAEKQATEGAERVRIDGQKQVILLQNGHEIAKMEAQTTNRKQSEEAERLRIRAETEAEIARKRAEAEWETMRRQTEARIQADTEARARETEERAEAKRRTANAPKPETVAEMPSVSAGNDHERFMAEYARAKNELAKSGNANPTAAQIGAEMNWNGKQGVSDRTIRTYKNAASTAQ